MGAGNHRLGIHAGLDTVVFSNQVITELTPLARVWNYRVGVVLDRQTEAAVDAVCRREATRRAPVVGKALKVRLRLAAEA